MTAEEASSSRMAVNHTRRHGENRTRWYNAAYAPNRRASEMALGLLENDCWLVGKGPQAHSQWDDRDKGFVSGIRETLSVVVVGWWEMRRLIIMIPSGINLFVLLNSIILNTKISEIHIYYIYSLYDHLVWLYNYGLALMKLTMNNLGRNSSNTIPFEAEHILRMNQPSFTRTHAFNRFADEIVRVILCSNIRVHFSTCTSRDRRY
jgi:hypothetical protein